MPTRPSRNSNAQPLPRHIQIIANGARRNPAAHFNRLVQLLRDERAWAVHPQLLSIIFRQLDKDPARHALLTEDDVICYQLGFKALDGILVARNATRGSNGRRSELDHSYILPAWPSVWKWMQYLYYGTPDGLLDTTFNAESRPTAFYLYIFNTVQCFLAAILMDQPSPALSSAVIATPGVLRMATEIWIRQGDRPSDPNDTNVVEAGPYTFAMALTAILQANPSEMSDLADGFGIGPQALAALLARPIRYVVLEREAQLRAYDAYIAVYLELARQAPEIMKMVLAQNILAAILYGLAFLLSIREPVPRHESITPGIAACLRFIVVAHALSGGFAWVSDAIRLKLVSSMLKCASRLPPSGTAPTERGIESDLLLIVNLLEQCVFHRPLLRALGRVMRQQSVLSLAGQVPKESWFSSHWERFAASVEFMSKAYATFDESEESKLKCASFKCNNIETTERFQKCAGCHQVVYCSETCQREDWQHGIHREDCKTAREIRSQQACHVSLRDRAFFTFLAEQQIKKDQQKIIEMRDRSPNDRAVKPLVLRIDHSITPAVLSLEPADEFHPVSCRGPPSITVIPLPPDSRSTPPPLIQPCVTVAYGDEQRAIVYTPSKVSGDLFGWFHGAGGDDEERKENSRRVYDAFGEAIFEK
ncbi:hypothetical protein LshimejAT787_0603500 [Lyophyllum shimeji]|uniref:MYND-type domain-containing protein n=1 Tax=Lyophyllum shimeji TaxID=47721 RepID=A0A9P3UN10_LYOSH|nr:hypothetical protein LshimejAT787_0603500 [Lyophyllum shimeji]